MPVRLLLISGSFRRGSTNTAVLRTAAAIAPQGVDAVLYAHADRLPHFNPDDDVEGGPPKAVADLRARLDSAHAVLICTPEYAGALPGSFKNLLEWTVGGVGLCDKPVAWINASGVRRSRSEVPLEPDAVEPVADPRAEDPEHEALLADSIGLALLVVLDTLSPAERIAFVLHDMFGVPFEEIAPIVERNAPATRQLASRARRRVRQEQTTGKVDRIRHAKLVDAFLAAARDGDCDRLLAALDPEVELRSDATAARFGAGQAIHGAREVAAFAQRARGATPVLLDGEAAAARMVDGPAAGRVHLHGQRRDDRCHRRNRRSGAPGPARPRHPR